LAEKRTAKERERSRDRFSQVEEKDLKGKGLLSEKKRVAWRNAPGERSADLRILVFEKNHPEGGGGNFTTKTRAWSPRGDYCSVGIIRRKRGNDYRAGAGLTRPAQSAKQETETRVLSRVYSEK